jgi:hypothetical protein
VARSGLHDHVIGLRADRVDELEGALEKSTISIASIAIWAS